MDLIKELGLEKCKAIVDGAPEWATHFNLDEETYTKRVKVVSIGFVSASYSLACLNYKAESQVACIGDLRTAIADHGTLIYEGTIIGSKYSFENSITDHCTDIRNHISPLTGVIER